MFDSSGAWILIIANFHSAWCCQNLHYYFGRIGRDSELLFPSRQRGLPGARVQRAAAVPWHSI